MTTSTVSIAVVERSSKSDYLLSELINHSIPISISTLKLPSASLQLEKIYLSIHHKLMHALYPNRNSPKPIFPALKPSSITSSLEPEALIP